MSSSNGYPASRTAFAEAASTSRVEIERAREAQLAHEVVLAPEAEVTLELEEAGRAISPKLARRAPRRAARARRHAEREEWASRIPPFAYGGFPRL